MGIYIVMKQLQMAVMLRQIHVHIHVSRYEILNMDINKDIPY